MRSSTLAAHLHSRAVCPTAAKLNMGCNANCRSQVSLLARPLAASCGGAVTERATHGCCRYTTDSSYKQYEQMRVAMEPLTYQFGVDIFYYGHVRLWLDVCASCCQTPACC